MGLDIVELVMAVEEEFQVDVDECFGDLRTVGDFHQFLCESLLSAEQQNRESSCPSFPAFFATRDALLGLTEAEVRDIRPSATLGNLILPQQRRQIWDQLEQDTGIRLPALHLSEGMLLNVLCTAGIALVGTASFFMTRLGGEAMPSIVVSSLLIPMFAFFASRPWAVALPESCHTVGDIVRRARPPRYPSQRPEWIGDSEEIWLKLVAIVSDQLDVPIQDISRDSKFVEDLKCG